MLTKKLITYGLVVYLCIIFGSFVIYQYYLKYLITPPQIHDPIEEDFSLPDNPEEKIQPELKVRNPETQKYITLYKYIFTIVANTAVYQEFDSAINESVGGRKDDQVFMSVSNYWMKNSKDILDETSTEISNLCIQVNKELDQDFLFEIYKTEQIDFLDCEMIIDFISNPDESVTILEEGFTELDYYLTQKGFTNDKPTSQIYIEISRGESAPQMSPLNKWLNESSRILFTRDKLRSEITHSELDWIDQFQGDIDSAERRLSQIDPTNINDIKLIAMMESALDAQRDTIQEILYAVNSSDDEMYLHSTIQSEKAGYFESMIVYGQLLSDQ